MKKVINFLLKFVLFILAWRGAIGLVRRRFKFPMPHFMADVIDNPLRRKIIPPDKTAIRHGIQPGMMVLEIGPGSGNYTVAAAQRVGARGRLVAVDIEPRMLKRTLLKSKDAGLTNLETRLADVRCLPFEANTFDLIFMITVIGELPDTHQALLEFRRVLKPGGTLAISEFLPDPDYSLPGTLTLKAEAAGFRRRELIGNLFYYTLILEKGAI